MGRPIPTLRLAKRVAARNGGDDKASFYRRGACLCSAHHGHPFFGPRM